MTSSLEELFDPIAFASAPDIDEDDNTNRNNARSNEKQKAVNSKSSSSSASRVLVIDDDAECPVCGREFAMDKIEMHVVSCLDEASEGNVAPPPVRAGRVAAEVDESGLINVELPHEDVVNDQTRHFQLWVERRKQEEADRLLAERMSRDAGAALPASPRRAPARVAIAIVDEERASEQLARRLAADDVAVQLDAESEALAKRLHEQEQAQIDARAAADAASARLAAEFVRREEELAKREADQRQRQARDLAVAEASLLADERRALEHERRALEDEKVARQLQLEEEREEELSKVREQFQREKYELELRMRNENAAAAARLQHEKALLEQQLIDLRDGQINAVDLPGVEYPQEWVRMLKGTNHLLVDVPRHSDEWRSVQHYFALGTRTSIVVRIQRNQNKQLWMWYSLMRQTILRKNSASRQAAELSEERFLYHGSKTDATDIILREGFDHRVSNINGRLGAGIYFAASSKLSLSYMPSSFGNDRMLVCRCTLGRVGGGVPGQRRPQADGSGRLYDCAGMQDGSQYALYDNAQAYPAYVITFRR